MPAARLLILAISTLAALAPAAGANVPPPVTKVNALRVPALHDARDGTVTTKVRYSETAATATASTGRTILLAKGNAFLLTSCVAYHLYGSAPASSCADRRVDTRGRAAAIRTHAPRVALYDQPRPFGSHRFGYFTTSVQVRYASGDTWALAAHSWPAGGLRGAAIAVAKRNAVRAKLPPNSPYKLTTRDNGAVDSGQPDSICRGLYVPTNGSAMPAGVSSSSPALAGAPAYYEIGQPTGARANAMRRGTVLVIHGGGWALNGQGGVERSRDVADRWRARGFQTVSVTVRPCGRSAQTIAWFYDHVRGGVGASEKICAVGVSAGANLALLLAALRPDVYCVVSEAGPTDLTTIQAQAAYDPDTRAFTQFNGGRYVHNLAAAAFGEENLASYSPAEMAGGPLKDTRVLQGFPANDAFVAWGQATELHAAMHAANPSAYVDTVRLAQGPLPFGHGAVSQAALDDFYAREVALVAAIPG